MERLGVVFDISHLGVGGVDDVLEPATRPFLATHSACLAIIDIHRNLGDEQLKGIAEIGPDFIEDYFQKAFDGWQLVPGSEGGFAAAEIERPAGLPKITEAMVRRGFGESDIRKVLGGNVMRVLHDVMGVPAA
jgi:membrane dipeptidase